jgi:HptB-dependent secretion and biofilm anti anti-sigma factor
VSIGWEIVNDVAIARPAKRFDLHCVKNFNEVIAIFGNHPEITEYRIDLTQTAYIDSAGLGMLLKAREAARVAGRRISLSNANGNVKLALDGAGLHRLFAVTQ